ncbi:hypothetical protein CC80DRAFT_406959 [Byssothecium circinans]|uniref:Uncharacterized protein n=1 Tax=Byssothecium circinans TaxID=147558 RepID=A0A6A5U4W7_9PLEO|nr:hypothetical protein CC80DRAFT_406959 [Byssothecium circinans]
MIYYGCSPAELESEVRRRKFRPVGYKDALSEGLKVLDEQLGSESTAVKTVALLKPFSPVDEFTKLQWEGKRLKMIKAQRPRTVVYWTMNTFFPVIQLFFESGLTCCIEGGDLSGAVIGMDNKLRSRLTDLSHEENGQLIKTTLPEKFAGKQPAIRIVEIQVARRTSVAVKQLVPRTRLGEAKPKATIVQEDHAVVGLRIEGMEEMGYIWARVPHDCVSLGEKTWGNVRVAGLAEPEDDVIVPFLGYPKKAMYPGGHIEVVGKKSLIAEFETRISE